MACILTELTENPINLPHIKNSVAAAEFGAFVEFSGTVRNFDSERSVVRLEYEAHPTASSVLLEIASEIEKKYPKVNFAISHRVGALDVGDLAFYVVAASAHRDEAFEVSRVLVEEVKTKIPVWKNQIFLDGSSEWVNSA